MRNLLMHLASHRSRIAGAFGLAVFGVVIGVGVRFARADATPVAGEQVPRFFTYRGQLTLDSGASAGASQLLRFSLYRSMAANQVAEFTENKIVALDPSNGAFAADIGECGPLACTGNLQATLEGTPASLYLGVAVCTSSFTTVNDCASWTELEGRQRLLSSLAAPNVTGQIVGYWRTSPSASPGTCTTGTAGGWVVGPTLSIAPPVRSRLVVRYVANVLGQGAVSASVDSPTGLGTYLAIAPEALATAKSFVSLRGPTATAGAVLEHAFVLTGQTDPLSLVLRGTASSGTPELCNDGSSFLEVTAYAE
jgi:hypothetical protein